jgi:hypothetical protein
MYTLAAACESLGQLRFTLRAELSALRRATKYGVAQHDNEYGAVYR